MANAVPRVRYHQRPSPDQKQSWLTSVLREQTFVQQILDTLEHVISQGVEIQLKVLQILVSLLTTDEPVPNAKGRKRVLVQGEDLGRVRVKDPPLVSTSK